MTFNSVHLYSSIQVNGITHYKSGHHYDHLGSRNLDNFINHNCYDTCYIISEQLCTKVHINMINQKFLVLYLSRLAYIYTLEAESLIGQTRYFS